MTKACLTIKTKKTKGTMTTPVNIGIHADVAYMTLYTQSAISQNNCGVCKWEEIIENHCIWCLKCASIVVDQWPYLHIPMCWIRISEAILIAAIKICLMGPQWPSAMHSWLGQDTLPHIFSKLKKKTDRTTSTTILLLYLSFSKYV